MSVVAGMRLRSPASAELCAHRGQRHLHEFLVARLMTLICSAVGAAISSPGPILSAAHFMQ
jgi:hypothetical protein